VPTYDYQCQKCGFEFEREQRITEDAIKTCPKCKSRQAKRLLSAPNFILKGGGWYADGYGSSGKGAKTTPSPDGTGGDSDGGGSGGKAAPKKEKASSDSGSGASSKASPKTSGGGTEARKSAA
jgi:putative FmdB family regulatory protein